MRGQRHTLAALYPAKDQVPIVQEAGWDPGPVWTDVENLPSNGFRSPDCPVRSQSLYLLPTRPTDLVIGYLNLVGGTERSGSRHDFLLHDGRTLHTKFLQEGFLLLCPRQRPLNLFSWISSAADTPVAHNLETKPHLVLPDPLISINFMNAVLHLIPS